MPPAARRRPRRPRPPTAAELLRQPTDAERARAREAPSVSGAKRGTSDERIRHGAQRSERADRVARDAAGGAAEAASPTTAHRSRAPPATNRCGARASARSPERERSEAGDKLRTNTPPSTTF